jgi:hypothetical protein
LFEMVLQVYFNGVDNVLDSRFEVRIFGWNEIWSAREMMIFWGRSKKTGWTWMPWWCFWWKFHFIWWTWSKDRILGNLASLNKNRKFRYMLSFDRVYSSPPDNLQTHTQGIHVHPAFLDFLPKCIIPRADQKLLPTKSPLSFRQSLKKSTATNVSYCLGIWSQGITIIWETSVLKSNTRNTAVDGESAFFKLAYKWPFRTFPRLYYKASYSFAQATRTVDILFIDTIVLCGNSIDVGGRSLLSWIMARRRIPNRPDPQWVDEAQRQWIWIEKELKDST